MKLALMADSLLTQGGAEKTFAVMCEAFPDADVHTTVYDPELAPEELRQYSIRQLVRGQRFRTYDGLRRNFLGAIMQMQRHSFTCYDVVLSSTAHLARFIRLGSARHISYTYYPFRILYEPGQYRQIRGVKGCALTAVRPWLRAWDRHQAARTEAFISISRASQAAIRRYYKAESEVMHPPILNLPREYRPVARDDFYLLVSRLEPWKRLEIAIQAFTGQRRRLLIVGDGPQREMLGRLAGPNVTFLGAVPESDLAEYYRRCRAVIHSTATEYGLTPIEANAHGTPAICLGVQGVLETMVPYHEAPEAATAVFYPEPTADSLRRALDFFETICIDPQACFRNAQRFSRAHFIDQLRQRISEPAGVAGAVH